MSFRSNPAARLSQLSANGSFKPVEEENSEEEDPEEIAYRERLRRLAEEDNDDEAASDPFGLNLGSSTRQTAASTIADDKLSLDAQRALDVLRRTSMAVADDEVLTNGRTSIWTDAGNEEEHDEATFKAQQARLKALAAAAQPASQVRTQLTRSTIPKPPGLADNEKERQERERQERLTKAETAAIVAATGISPEKIRPHVDMVVKAKVGVVKRVQEEKEPIIMSKSTATVPPPPGLGSRVVDKQPSSVAKKDSVPPPPGLGAPSAPATLTPPGIPPSRKSGVVPSAEEEKQPATTPQTVVPPAHVSADMLLRAKNLRNSSASEEREEKKPSYATQSLTNNDGDMVTLYGSVTAPRALLDVLSWRTPLLAVGWMLFSGFLVLALLSKQWSTLSVWAGFAIVRIAILLLSRVLKRLLPEKFSSYVSIEHDLYLPGSLKVAGDIMKVLSHAMHELFNAKAQKDIIKLALYSIAAVMGVVLNLGIVTVLVVLAFSLIAATYVAIPTVFDPLVRRSPFMAELLAKV